MKDIVRIDAMPAYVSDMQDDARAPGLVVIHEIWGLVPHIKDIADRCAERGYRVIAPDLFFDTPLGSEVAQDMVEKMNNPETRDGAQVQMRTLLDPIRSSPEFSSLMIERLRGCVSYLEARGEKAGPIGSVGFCFGGTYSMALAASEPRIRAVVSFYGQPLSAEKLSSVQCPLLAFYGDKDAPLMDSLPSFRSQAASLGVSLDVVVYEGAAHAFFNDTNESRYDPVAAEDAWKRTNVFLEQYLKA